MATVLTPPLHALPAFAESVAAEAGALALEFWRRRDQLAIAHKHALDVVTEADRAVEDLIRRRIEAAFPGDAFFGEESVQECSPEGRTWVVDPIDGTLNFVRGMDDWAISLGVLERGRPVLGVIAMPARALCVSGGAGFGASCNGAALEGCRAAPADVIVGIGFFATTPVDDQLAVIGQIVSRGYSFRRNGSASVTLAMLARGQLDAVVAVGVSAWDVVAGIAIAEALGYSSSPHWNGLDLTSKVRVACASPALLPQLLPALSR